MNPPSVTTFFSQWRVQRTILIVGGVFLAVACQKVSQNAQQITPHAAGHKLVGTSPHVGKPAAPIRIEADISSSSATVTVVFAADGRDINVNVRGVEGLTLQSAAALSRTSVQAGESLALPLTYSENASGMLSVVVTGTFASGPMSRVSAFPVGNMNALNKTQTRMVEEPEVRIIDGIRSRVLRSSAK